MYRQSWNINKSKGYLALLLLLLIQLSGSEILLANHGYFYKEHQKSSEERSFRVKAMHVTQNGLLWLATDKGLCYYDGVEYHFTHYADSTAGKALQNICESPDGKIYVSDLRNRIFLLGNNGLERAVYWPDTLHPKITDMAFDRYGYLWVGTAGDGVYVWHDNELMHFDTPQISDNYINDIHSAGKYVYLGTDNGLTRMCRVDGKMQTSIIRYDDGLPDYIVSSIASSSDTQKIWLGFQAGGICEIDSRKMKITTLDTAVTLIFGEINDILEYKPGVLWIADDVNGLIERSQYHDRPVYRVIRPIMKNRGQRILDLEIDGECNLWLVSSENGLLSTNRQISMPDLSEKNEKAPEITAVHADADGIMWYANHEGLYRYDPGINGEESIRFIGISHPEKKELIISIYSLEPGKLWLGTFGSGLYYFNEHSGQLMRIGEKDGLINNNILSITGRGNELWLATLGGAERLTINSEVKSLEDISLKGYTTRHGLGTNYIYQVHMAKDSSIWFATDGKGISCLKDGEIVTYDKQNGLNSNVIISITEDSRGKIWFASPESGIYSIRGDTIKKYDRSCGIRDLHISSITADKYDRIVIVHESGIDILDPKINHVTFPVENSFITSLKSDINNRSVDRDGNIWIGGKDGLLYYAPALPGCREVPATILLEVNAMLRPMLFKEMRVLPYSKNHLSFEFKGLWYKNPEKVHYQYKLVGFDLDWHLTADNTAIYPSLHPGRYTFKVRSSIDGNFKNLPVESFSFRINPPFWQTPWFIIGILLFIIGSIYSYVRFREQRLKALEHLEKEKIEFQLQTLRSQVNPHFLFNSFNTLLNMIDIDQKAASDYVQRLSDFFRNILTYKEKELITLPEELNILEDYYYLQKKRFGKNFNINVKIENPDQYCIPPMTLQLLVENALKHNIVSASKPLKVEIYIEDGRLIVRNNLQLKRKVEQSTRMGLSNIVNRYRMLFDTEVEVYSGKGYFTVKLPLIKC